MHANKPASATHANNSATHTETGINSNSQNYHLPKELHKPIIRKFLKSKVYSFLK